MRQIASIRLSGEGKGRIKDEMQGLRRSPIPEQPLGCEDLGKPHNAADRFYSAFSINLYSIADTIRARSFDGPSTSTPPRVGVSVMRSSQSRAILTPA